MSALIARVRRDPGGFAVLVALALTAAIYAPAIGRGLVSYGDAALVGDNWISAHPSWRSLGAIMLDLGDDTRHLLGGEYQPIRDLSILGDHAIWGTWYGGHHLTSIVLYLAAIAVWFAAITRFGVDRRVAGVMTLLWALHPSHAEAVAWLAARGSLLGSVFAGLAALGYARFRTGGRSRWLAVAVIAAVAMVWSDAATAIVVGVLAGLELVVPAPRRSWRRSLGGLAAIAAACGAALVPVIAAALPQDPAPAGWLEMAIGIHGFDLRLAAMAPRNAVSYPIGTQGPSVLDLVLGAAGVLVIAGALRRSPAVVRAAAVLWLACCVPVCGLVVADRYLLVPTLGIALAGAYGLSKIRPARLQLVAIAAVALAAGARSIDAQDTWRSSVVLWERALQSNPDDDTTWSMYASALVEAGRPRDAFGVVQTALQRHRTPQMLLRKALIVLAHGRRPDAMRTMRDAAVAGEPLAMSNLALMLLDAGAVAEALEWAARGSVAQPMYAPGFRTYGKVALAAKALPTALLAFERAYELEPHNLANRYNLGLVLVELDRRDDARVHFHACVDDPRVGELARAALSKL
ncbi:MAG: hypothetical protein ABI867_32610 [Kofleriaceae bacterium]